MSFFNSDQFTRGGHTWLDSRDGTDVPRTGTIKISALPAAFEKVVPSGLPVKLGADDGADEGYLVPAEDGDTPVGFVLGYFPVEASLDGVGLPVGYIWRGAISTQNLPVESFTVPATPGLFSYVGGNKGETAPEGV